MMVDTKLNFNSSLCMQLQILCCGWLLLSVNYAVSFSCTQTSRHWVATTTTIDTESKWTRAHLYELGSSSRLKLVTNSGSSSGRRRGSSSSSNNNSKNIASLSMRDRSSSYWFSVGDRVKVVDDVYTKTQNLKGRTGKVVETWEKCDVDPTCCCAEQVDTDMAVRVFFQNTNQNENDTDNNCNDENNDDGTFYYHFAEEELVKV